MEGAETDDGPEDARVLEGLAKGYMYRVKCILLISAETASDNTETVDAGINRQIPERMDVDTGLKNLAFILHRSYKAFAGHWCTSDGTDVIASWLSIGGGNRSTRRKPPQTVMEPETLHSYTKKSGMN